MVANDANSIVFTMHNHLHYDDTVVVYGRKSADRTENGNDVIFFVFLATVFGNVEVWKVRK